MASTGILNPLGVNPSPVQGNNPITVGAPPTVTGSRGAGANQPGQALNPFGFGVLGGGAINANLAGYNELMARLSNQLAPQMANAMGQYGGQAGNVFGQLANLGSPYYRQAQQSVFNQGVQQAQQQGAQARQQLGAQGYGSTPSGAEAGMLGGMATGTSGNLAQNYLQQLFNNQQLQAQGAQGLMSLAQIFNPTQLLSAYASPTSNSSVQQSNLGSILSGIGSLIGGPASAGIEKL